MKKTLIVLSLAILVILSVIFFWPKENTVTPLPNQTQTPETPEKNPTAISIYDDSDFPPGSYEAYIRDLTSGDNSSGEVLNSENIAEMTL